MLGERPLDRRRIECAHEPPDVLSSARVRRAAAQFLRLEQRLEQLRRQIESLQLVRLEAEQPFAEALQRLGVAFAGGAAGPCFFSWVHAAHPIQFSAIMA